MRKRGTKPALKEMVRKLDSQRAGDASLYRSIAFIEEPGELLDAKLFDVKNNTVSRLSEDLDFVSNVVNLEFETGDGEDKWPDRGFAKIEDELVEYSAVRRQGPGFRRFRPSKSQGTSFPSVFDLGTAIVPGGVYARAQDVLLSDGFLDSSEPLSAYGQLIIEDDSERIVDLGISRPSLKSIWFKVSPSGLWTYKPLGAAIAAPRPSFGASIDFELGKVYIPRFSDVWAVRGDIAVSRESQISINDISFVGSTIEVIVERQSGKDATTRSRTGPPGPMFANGTMLRHDGYSVDRDSGRAVIRNVRALGGLDGDPLPPFPSTTLVELPNEAFSGEIAHVGGGVWSITNVSGYAETGEFIVYVPQPGDSVTLGTLWNCTVRSNENGVLFFNASEAFALERRDVAPVLSAGSVFFFQSSNSIALSKNQPSPQDTLSIEMWCEAVINKTSEFEFAPFESGDIQTGIVFDPSKDTVHELSVKNIITGGIVANSQDDGRFSQVVSLGDQYTLIGELEISTVPKYVLVLPRPLGSSPEDFAELQLRPELAGEGIATRLTEYIAKGNNIRNIIVRVQLRDFSVHEIRCESFVPDRTRQTGGRIVLERSVSSNWPFHFSGQTLLAYQFVDYATGRPLPIGLGRPGVFFRNLTPPPGLAFNSIIPDTEAERREAGYIAAKIREDNNNEPTVFDWDIDGFDWAFEKHYAIIGGVTSGREQAYRCEFAMSGTSDVKISQRDLPAGLSISESGWELDRSAGRLLVPPVQGSSIFDWCRIRLHRFAYERPIFVGERLMRTVQLLGVSRGVSGRSSYHRSGSEVVGTIVAQHHVSLAKSVVGIQRTLGRNGTTDERSIDWMISAMEQASIIGDDADAISAMVSLVDGDVKVEISGPASDMQLFMDGEPTTVVVGSSSAAPFTTRFRPKTTNPEPVLFVRGESTQLAVTLPARGSQRLPEPSIFSPGFGAPLTTDGLISRAFSVASPSWLTLPEGKRGVTFGVPGLGSTEIAAVDLDSELVQVPVAVPNDAYRRNLYYTDVFTLTQAQASTGRIQIDNDIISMRDANIAVYLRGLRLDKTDVSVVGNELRLSGQQLLAGDTLRVEVFVIPTIGVEEAFDEEVRVTLPNVDRRIPGSFPETTRSPDERVPYISGPATPESPISIFYEESSATPSADRTPSDVPGDSDGGKESGVPARPRKPVSLEQVQSRPSHEQAAGSKSQRMVEDGRIRYEST